VLDSEVSDFEDAESDDEVLTVTEEDGVWDELLDVGTLQPVKKSDNRIVISESLVIT
jgi:hypothetical protein